MARRSNEERSEATKAALIEAAVASLLEKGWAATTAVEVCARAGVTRGALVHHFTSLAALHGAAILHVQSEMVAAATSPTTLVEAIDETWRSIGSPRFKAVLEALLAMANDVELGAEIGPHIASFAKLVSPDELDVPAMHTDEGRDHYLLAREAMLGLAVGRAINRGAPLGHEGAVLDLVRRQAAAIEEKRNRHDRGTTTSASAAT